MMGNLFRRSWSVCAHRSVRRSSPRLEVLEDRTVPTTFTVTNTLDDGSTGSLRDAVRHHPGRRWRGVGWTLGRRGCAERARTFISFQPPCVNPLQRNTWVSRRRFGVLRFIGALVFFCWVLGVVQALPEGRIGKDTKTPMNRSPPNLSERLPPTMPGCQIVWGTLAKWIRRPKCKTGNNFHQRYHPSLPNCHGVGGNPPAMSFPKKVRSAS